MLEACIEKEKVFSQAHGTKWKDVERPFGALQAKGHTVASLASIWNKEYMKEVMMCVIILNNTEV